MPEQQGPHPELEGYRQKKHAGSLSSLLQKYTTHIAQARDAASAAAQKKRLEPKFQDTISSPHPSTACPREISPFLKPEW